MANSLKIKYLDEIKEATVNNLLDDLFVVSLHGSTPPEQVKSSVLSVLLQEDFEKEEAFEVDKKVYFLQEHKWKIGILVGYKGNFLSVEANNKTIIIPKKNVFPGILLFYKK